MNILYRKLVPKFTELDIFTVGYSVALVICAHGALLINGPESLEMFYYPLNALRTLVGMFGVFALLSTYHIFSNRKKTMPEKQFLLFLMILMFVATIVVLATNVGGAVGTIFIILDGLYVFWLLACLISVRKGNHVLIDSMLVDSVETNTAVLLVAYSSFILYLFMIFFFGIGWVVTLAMLFVLSAPLSKTLSHYSYIAHTKRHDALSKKYLALILALPLVILFLLGIFF